MRFLSTMQVKKYLQDLCTLTETAKADSPAMTSKAVYNSGNKSPADCYNSWSPVNDHVLQTATENIKWQHDLFITVQHV